MQRDSLSLELDSLTLGNDQICSGSLDIKKTPSNGRDVLVASLANVIMGGWLVVTRSRVVTTDQGEANDLAEVRWLSQRGSCN